jgi:hypothetical protein
MEQSLTHPSRVLENTPPCPHCGQQGRGVSPVTIGALVTTAPRLRSLGGFQFCATPACDVAYFHPASRETIIDAEVRVPIFQKRTEPERLVCYCFQHTVAEIQQEVTNTGVSRIATNIKAKCAQGLDDCAHNNPQGSCCLGNVQRAIREATRDNQPPPSKAGSCCCR